MLKKVLDQKALLNTLLVGVVLGGVLSYLSIGKLEDAEIKVKTAVVVTLYPGATAHEVELEVTDVLEKAVQSMENIDDISSRSMPGYSEITVNINKSVSSSDIPQMWDLLRRKVRDIQTSLPAGAQTPIVADDFGDVYGIFVAMTGEGYEYDEFSDYAEFLKRELLEVDGIKRVALFGTQMEAVDISISAEKLASLSINPIYIVRAMYDHGQVVNPGSIISGSERIRLSVGSKYSTIDEIKNILVQVPDGGSFKLGDIAEVKRTFYEPKREGLTYNGERAISLALSMESGVNVVTIGDEFDKKIEELQASLPAGIEVHSVFSQPDRVNYAINGFIVNLVESVLIVMVVLLFSMGMRSGLLISSGLLFTILGTFIVMSLFDIQLQRISLAAIIVAMGMLVDNSIVVADGILIDLKTGVDRKLAFTNIVKQTALPLLGATLIAILAFMPLALSPDSAGEYLSSLFYVLAISLSLSWIFAVVQTPYMASIFYKKSLPKAKKNAPKNPFETPFYQKFRGMVEWVLLHKRSFLVASVVLLVASLYSFQFVKFKFMPTLDYNQFLVEYKLPKGSDLTAVEKDMQEISEELLSWDEVYNVTAAAGKTPARYTLIRPMANSSSNYGEFVIDVEDYDASVVVGEKIMKYLEQNYPYAEARKRVYGPIFTEYDIEVQFSGPDPAVLRNLAEEAKAVMRKEEGTVYVTDNWKNKVKVLTPEYSVEEASKVGVSRSDVSNAIAVATDGLAVGVMYEGNEMLPVKLKLDEPIGKDIDKVSSIPVWGMQSQSSVPLGKVTENIKMEWEENEVYRYNNKRAIRAQCDPASGYLAEEVEGRLKPKVVEAIKLPHGYTMEWKGAGADSAESQQNLFKNLPLALGIMLIIVIALFNNIKQAVIIFTIFPFAMLGIVVGFVSTGATFTFIGIIGALGLIGMMIKNAIVLLDEINHNIKEGKDQLESIVASTLSRMRPVFLASATTILGMLPLLFDVMFQSMAITIIFGLLFGTLITLFVIPVLYALLFRVNTKPLRKKGKEGAVPA
ncbi:efflux RND transporter permease subunit [Flammeovirgaceae bacterium SG7u.111]|nr:efflux RND transporter permease subunit [Flammeovirgaceae bacterium SG7u.132]WPO36089.1 efflux RND transporter permease subunit [Flammeovirgaceae bacterium SG7u.111]